MLADIPQGCPILKDLIVDVSVGQVLKGLQYLHLTLGCSAMCVMLTRVLFLSLSGSGRGNSNIYIKGLPAVLEGVGQLVCLTGFTNDAISAPKLANFLLHLFQVGLAWHTIGIYRSAISAFLEPHRIHKASNHPFISKLMHHFYSQHPASHKQFDPWDVECLLSLLESWAPASSLSTFKLAWKTATLLALVTGKCCSDLTLLCVDNQHLFSCSVMLLFLFHCLEARQIVWVIFPLRFVLSLTPMLIFALFLFEGLLKMY